MFDNLDKQTSNVSGEKAVDDIFAETEGSQIAGAELKSGNIEAQSAGLASHSYDEEANEHSEKSAFKYKNLVIISFSLLILVALAYLVYVKFLSTPKPAEQSMVDNAKISDNELNNAIIPSVNQQETNIMNEKNNNQGSIVEPMVGENRVVEPVDNASMTDTVIEENPAIPVVTAPVDSDADSLTDMEEISLGTNINLIDSDFDGLSDYEEVRVYYTNPLNADTDGDGYTDGSEIQNGYNPNGEGILQ
ncbi:hypothetical protein JXE04_01470 [Patescibacteria group bacterium]|nr:hypothetical protein [Patescibacteria group bacterium]